MPGMSFVKGSFAKVSPGIAGAAAAAYCACVVYSVITSFERPTQSYHANISYDLIYWTSLGAVAYLLCFGKHFEWRLDRSLPWLALAACMLLSSMFSDNPAAAWARVRLYFAILMFGIVLWGWFGNAGSSIVPLVLGAAGSVHVAILMLVMMAVPQANSADPHNQLWLPYHAHIRHVAYHGMIAACAGMALGLLNGRLRSLGFFVAVVSLFGIVYFGARGALAGWIVFVLIILVVLPRRVVTLASCAVVLVVAFSTATVVSRELASSPFTGSVMERSNSLEAVIDSTGRTRIWSDALAAVAKKPVIGYGPEGYLHSRCCLRDTSQPHNAVVQLLIEVGVLGLAVVCWLLWRTLGRDALQYWRDRGTMRIDPCRAMLFATMGGMTAFALVDGLYYHVVPLTMFAIIAALYASQAPARQIPAPV